MQNKKADDSEFTNYHCMKEDVGAGLSVLIDKTRYSKTFFDSE